MNEIVGKSQAHEESTELIAGIGQIGIAIQNISTQLKNHEERITSVEDTMRVNGVQEMKITKQVNRVVIGWLGGKESVAYQDRSLRSRVYSAINAEIKDKFGVPRRAEVPAKDYLDVMKLISNWEMSYQLKSEVANANNQLKLVGM